ncbi:MAG: type II secretion system protein [Candidatus Omnitrophota bacterium]
MIYDRAAAAGKSSAFALIALIMIMVLVGIIVAGLTAFVSQSIQRSVAGAEAAKTIYLAQAGIFRALADYRTAGSWSEALNVNVDGKGYYHVGRDSDFLLADASAVHANGRVINAWPLRSLSGSSVIAATSMTVEWSFGGMLTRAKIGDQVVYSGTGVSSPATIALNPAFALGPGDVFTGDNHQYLQFDTNVNGSAAVRLLFKDGSSAKIALLKNGLCGNREFSVTATGEFRGSSTWRRTVQATYDTGSGTITSWQESPAQITP